MMKKRKNFLLASIFIGVVIGLTSLANLNWRQIFKYSSDSRETLNSSQANPTSYPSAKKNSDGSQPFAELTIPYLRQQQFESELTSLEEVGSNNQYRSYLTSYSSEDLTINGLLTIPTGEQPENGWPAIVFIHGYIPPAQYQTQERYQDYVDYLARNGFVVFKIDLRGHGQSEGIATGAYFSGDYIIDTLNAYAALQSFDQVDPNRIGLWGHSMGGNIVLRSMTANPSIPAGVIWGGTVFTYTDFEQFGIQDDSYQRPDEDSPRRQRRSELFETHGRFDASSPFWQQVMPTNYLEKLQGAIQLHHATNDPVTDVRYSRNLNQILNQTNIPHQLYEYQAGGHNLVSPVFSQAMQRTVDFFEEYLGKY
jgi:dipeptidyl aminopeptidase/acylaminoacyl peptidase